MAYDVEIQIIRADLGLGPEVKITPVAFTNTDRVAEGRGKNTRSVGMQNNLGGGYYRIDIAPVGHCSYAGVLETLAHELRHVWQDEHKLVVLKRNRWTWMGSDLTPGQSSHYVSSSASWETYRAWPWEVDARAYSALALKRLFPDVDVNPARVSLDDLFL